MSPRFLWKEAYSFGPAELMVSLPIQTEITRAHLHGQIGSPGKDLSWSRLVSSWSPRVCVLGGAVERGEWAQVAVRGSQLSGECVE